ncbi:MAG: glycerol kinase [Gemmatimonadetes bacterium SCN 70-22]|nr:MAG: glycerol kinase [Gemmatimonadetes bacterium SCN 70-22]
MKHVLAIDQGTTGTTCLVVRADGAVAARAYREITQHYPRPGWVEHDAVEIFQRTCEAAREAIEMAGVTPVAVGITNQRETIIVWERETGRPVSRAIVWQDRRTSARCAELAPRGAEIATRTGLVVDPYFSATKLEWLLREEALERRAARGELLAGTIDAWLIWTLTGGEVHATDPTNASRTMLYDIDAGAWSPELCALFGVPLAMLPDVRRSAGDFGVARREHLGVELPICGVAGDQQAALYGQGCWAGGEGKNTYGTGAFLLFNAGAARPKGGGGLLTTVACDASGGPVYALEAAIFVAGAAVQWLRDGLQLVESAAETESLARSVESTGGVYFVPALVGLGAPHWAPEARGTIVGITRGTSRAHLARAALEAMAYGTADVAAAVREQGVALDRLRVDGGATANDWLMQFQSDVLQVVVERPAMIETTALGAAGLAGVTAGVWRSPGEFLAAHDFTRFSPQRAAAEVRAGYAGWQRAVRAALAWADDRP